MKVVHFTEHATFTIALRAIDPAWIERALRSPAWTSVDPRDSTVEAREGVHLDLDAKGWVVGIEVLAVTRNLPGADLTKIDFQAA